MSNSLISRSALLEKLSNCTSSWGVGLNRELRAQWSLAVKIKDNILREIKAAPEVEAVPIVHGRWVVDEGDSGEFGGYPAFIEFHCSICNEEYSLENGQYGWTYGDDIPLKFCHECGAKMDLKGDNA